jgi:acetyl-CoA acetyltransferase
MRGKTAIVGIGQTPYYKRGTSPDPELKLCLRAIVAACEDAGIDPRDVDGFVSYGSERSDGQKMMTALGTRELRFGALAWMHGGGIPGALTIAAGAILTGQAQVVAVYRSIAEARGERLRITVAQSDTSPQYLVNGIDSPASLLAFRSQRLIEKYGVPKSCFKAIAEASYHHARNNPRAYGRNIELDDETYANARPVADPFNLFDCSRENDAAACVLVVAAERARDFRKPPAYILAAPMGTQEGGGALEENIRPLSTASQRSVARRLWEQTGLGPSDVDVIQLYCNMTGPAIGSLIDHGFCTFENAAEVITFENLIAPTGKLPINTAGGDLAEGFIHGMGLLPEAVRQIRGESVNQIPNVQLSMMTGGPGDTATSTALLGTADAR